MNRDLEIENSFKKVPVYLVGYLRDNKSRASVGKWKDKGERNFDPEPGSIFN